MPGSATDPTALYRLRDGIYAPDLLIVAVAELDLFTRVARADGADVAGLCGELQLNARAADVMVTYLTALGMLERDGGDRVGLTRLAAEHLVAESPLDRRPTSPRCASDRAAPSYSRCSGSAGPQTGPARPDSAMGPHGSTTRSSLRGSPPRWTPAPRRDLNHRSRV
jgi:hypothetical protein